MKTKYEKVIKFIQTDKSLALAPFDDLSKCFKMHELLQVNDERIRSYK